MGRKIPIAESPSSNHHLISFSLFIACIAATMAVISFLCGSLSRKKSPSSSGVDKATTENSQLDISSNGKDASHKPAAEFESSEAAQLHDEELRPLPPPPSMQHKRAASYHHRSNSAASSHGKLSSSMSMRVLGNAITPRKEEKKLKHEDSVWKKTIILGEKCRVPQEDDDTILYDEKGNRISTYHPKTPSTALSMSRQNSGSDSDAVPR